MKKFKQLDRFEMKKVTGGADGAPDGSCTADCGGGKSVTCPGSCGATDGVGCYTLDNGTLDVKTCSAA